MERVSSLFKIIGEQTNIISHLTAQLQGINWLVTDMKVNLHDLINDELLFNVSEGVKIFDTEGVSPEESEKQVSLEF